MSPMMEGAENNIEQPESNLDLTNTEDPNMAIESTDSLMASPDMENGFV
jgi:hypothetical protein